MFTAVFDGYPNIAAPINALLKKSEADILGALNEDQTSSFNVLISKIRNQPVLAFTLPGHKYSTQTLAHTKYGVLCFNYTQMGIESPFSTVNYH